MRREAAFVGRFVGQRYALGGVGIGGVDLECFERGGCGLGTDGGRSFGWAAFAGLLGPRRSAGLGVRGLVACRRRSRRVADCGALRVGS